MQVEKNGTCVCLPPYYELEAGCLPCPPNFIFDNTKKTCVNPALSNTTTNVTNNTTNTTNTTHNTTNATINTTITCGTNQILVNNNCVCDDNSINVSGVCQKCDSSFFKFGDICVPCPYNCI